MTNSIFARANIITPGIYKASGELYKKFTDDLYDTPFYKVVDNEGMHDDLVVILPKKIPYGVGVSEDLRKHVFDYCENIVGVHAENYIGEFPYRFNCCTNLEQVYLPDKLITYDPFNFYDTPNLKGIYINDNNKFLKTIDGVLYSKDEKTLYLFPPNHEFKLSNKVQTLAKYALSEYKTDILMIPDGVKFIEPGALGYVKTVYLPDSIEFLHEGFISDMPPEKKTIFCSKNTEKEIRQMFNEKTLNMMEFKRVTLDDLISDFSLNKVNEILKTYGERAR